MKKCAQGRPDSDLKNRYLNLVFQVVRAPFSYFICKGRFLSIANKLCDLKGKVTPLAPGFLHYKKKNVSDLEGSIQLLC